MGKLVGAIQFNGKVANVVGMRGENGRNYIRERKYEVANHNTKAQQDVRTKFVLAGLLSKLTPADLIVGLAGGSKRQRRSRFTKIINDRATIMGNQANLTPNNLVFSEGALYPMSGADVTLTYSGTALTASLPQGSTLFDDENLASVIIIGVFSQGRLGPYVSEGSAVITKTTTSVTIPGNGQLVNVYAIPVLRADGATDVAYETAVSNIEATNSYAVASEAAVRGVLNYGASQYLSSPTQG